MASFDVSADPELGVACNRLAEWVEPLPAGALIDRGSGLTECDPALILRHLRRTRHGGPADGRKANDEGRRAAWSSVPITARG